jgi:hypothetical protein
VIFPPLCNGGGSLKLRGRRTGLVMVRQLSQRRALRRIERDLARSDPRFDALFMVLTGPGRNKEMPVVEQTGSKPTVAVLSTGTAGEPVTGSVRTGVPSPGDSLTPGSGRECTVRESCMW